MSSCTTQPPAIRAVADLLELLMEATTQLSEALEQFSGEERRNNLQSRIREHEWEMEKRDLLKERGALREQLELQKDLYTLAEEKLRRVQAAATAASPATPVTPVTPAVPPTPQRTTSPSWLPILPPVVSVSSILITFPELSPKSTGTAPSHEIKVPSRPTTAEHEPTKPPVLVKSLQPITNLPRPPVSPLEVVSRRRVRPATADSATRASSNGTTGSASVPPVSQAATLVASTGEHPSRSRTVLRGPRAQSALTLPPPRNVPTDPTPKTPTGTNADMNADMNTRHSLTPAVPSSTKSDREAALQTLTSTVALLSSSQRHSVRPALNQVLWSPNSGSLQPPSSISGLVAVPTRRESLPTVTQRTATLIASAPQRAQPQSQSQSVMNHVRPPRAQRPTSPPTSPPPSFNPAALARRTDVRRSSREIVI